jgi:perosamine synthetase
VSIGPEEIVARLKSVVGEAPFTPLHEPRFAGREWHYLKECIDTGWVSYAGKFVDAFEQKLAEISGVARAVAVVNGTAALHMCCILAGVRPGEEVIVPALTFVATANAVAHAGAIPHLADSDEATLGIDATKLRAHLSATTIRERSQLINRATGRRIAALMPMHTFGHPADMDALLAVAGDFGLPVIEDAAESLGSTYKGRPCGSFGLVSALSFNGNKIVTTGGGGAILTNDEELARRARHLTTTAKKPHAWEFDHDEVAWNYRMPNLNAAVGLAQIEQLPDFLKCKRQLAAEWQTAFAGLKGVHIFVPPDFAGSNHWLNALVLDREFAGWRDQILERSNAARLMTRPVWKLMHHLPAFRDVPRMNLDCAESLEQRIINIPSSVKHGMPHG